MDLKNRVPTGFFAYKRGGKNKNSYCSVHKECANMHGVWTHWGSFKECSVKILSKSKPQFLRKLLYSVGR